jgi:hypothetical protein
MNYDLEALSRIQDLGGDEFDLFREALHVLTTKTFIIRGIEKDRELYSFIAMNRGLFEAWFSCLDAELAWDDGAGVIAFRGSGAGRLRLSREEICAALCLRLLYEDKKLEISLTAFPVATVSDFQQKYNAMTGEEIRKTALINELRRLSSCKLISLGSQDYSDPEALIQRDPSIPFSIGREALDEALAFLEKSGEGEEEQ